ncbi:hypothetical protein QBC40DRAFT_291757 [Triangularia verruculosa]|uniref:Uncharacterized protein n=1 Tax=Triangularia verruculosa TaxID=2587418 RepID=A0AAN6XRS6_9PEZI|nr:hypothetical protein QBC40DRAFT_291757 [Triangularia verruculosa]
MDEKVLLTGRTVRLANHDAGRRVNSWETNLKLHFCVKRPTRALRRSQARNRREKGARVGSSATDDLYALGTSNWTRVLISSRPAMLLQQLRPGGAVMDNGVPPPPPSPDPEIFHSAHMSAIGFSSCDRESGGKRHCAITRFFFPVTKYLRCSYPGIGLSNTTSDSGPPPPAATRFVRRPRYPTLIGVGGIRLLLTSGEIQGEATGVTVSPSGSRGTTAGQNPSAVTLIPTLSLKERPGGAYSHPMRKLDWIDGRIRISSSGRDMKDPQMRTTSPVENQGVGVDDE